MTIESGRALDGQCAQQFLEGDPAPLIILSGDSGALDLLDTKCPSGPPQKSVMICPQNVRAETSDVSSDGAYLHPARRTRR